MLGNGRSPFDMKNGIKLTGASIEAGILQQVVDGYLTHKSVTNTAAHTIANVTGLQTALDASDTTASTALSSHVTGVDEHTIASTTGLQAALDSKQASLTGLTGTIDVITGVDFVGQTLSTKRLTYSNGVLISIVAL